MVNEDKVLPIRTLRSANEEVVDSIVGMSTPQFLEFNGKLRGVDGIEGRALDDNSLTCVPVCDPVERRGGSHLQNLL